MPISNPDSAAMFNEDYDILAEYVQDDSRIPLYNPSDSGEMFQPGEPIPVRWGADEDPSSATDDLECRVYMAQGRIKPGEIGMLLKYFTGDFPCDFSANVVLGEEVYWDVDNNVVSLEGDVTNGFVLGDISYALQANVLPTVDANDRVICATSASTKCRVISRNAPATVKGTVVIY